MNTNLIYFVFQKFTILHFDTLCTSRVALFAKNIIVKSCEKQGREPVRTGYIHYIDESHKMIKIRKCEKGHIASFM